MTDSSTSKYLQFVIFKFDGHYDHWTKLMENFVRSKEYWYLVEHGISVVLHQKLNSN